MRFDDAHVWAGDALPAAESAQFQQGKYNALLKLVPYAREGSREAAAVVLKLDGSEFDFAVGEIDSVDSRIPAYQGVAHLHTHPYEWAQSEADWSSFLLIGNVEQAHVITPLRTFSLHKPIGWKMPFIEQQSVIEARYMNFYATVIALSPNWSPAKDTIWTRETTRLMARRYNIHFREGIHT